MAPRASGTSTQSLWSGRKGDVLMGDRADGLDWVAYRVGLVAGLRSAALAGRPVGLIITASHNPVSDNGVPPISPFPPELS